MMVKEIDENFTHKAGAQRYAAKYGVALVAPDTSPRGAGIQGESDSWDFGVGAGFYVNATVSKFASNYNMYDYITKELIQIIESNFPVDPSRKGIFGHSMGGHGALICALKNPGLFTSCSVFSPICHPSNCPWGIKAFTGYLGENKEEWKAYDATELVPKYKGPHLDILADVGTADEFLEKKQLLPEDLVQAVKGNQNISLQMRFQDGYDHSYYFISTFIEDHIKFHAMHFGTSSSL